MFEQTINYLNNWTYTEDGSGYTAMGKTFNYETGTTVIADSVIERLKEEGK